MRRLAYVSLTLGLISLASPAEAYIGPGMGLGALAVVLGVVGSAFLAIVALLWYPLKTLVRKRRGRSSGAAGPGAEETTDAPR